MLLPAQNPERLFSQEEIYRAAWQLPDLRNARTAKVRAARLRHKPQNAMPGCDFIGTVWKRGYRFRPKGKRAEAD